MKKTPFTHPGFLIALLLLIPELVFGQCQTNVDFNTWIQEGVPSNGNWQVQGGGVSVNQTINGDPTFYVSPDTFINVLISGTFTVNDNQDDDYPGFVFGYREPNGWSTNYDCYLFSWKRVTQTKWTSNGQTQVAQEGMTLARVTGNIGTADAILTNFWGHSNTPQYQVLGTNYSPTAGWIPFATNVFTLLYTSTRITIAVNNVVVFDIPGCYERGRFGFYNYSQPGVNYSNFSYRLISNFEPTTYQICEGINTNFNFTDSTCSGSASAIANIASWAWDFGDGSTSTQINPTHLYTTPGTYNVQLVITDVNGCQDSVTKPVTVYPPPTVNVGSDVTKCPNEIIQLNSTIPGGASYSWSPPTDLTGAGTSTPTTSSQVPITYVASVTDTLGCQATDTINILIHPFQPTAVPTNVSCFGADDGYVAAGIAGTGPYQYAWRNSTGNIVRSVSNGPGVDTLRNLAPGTYSVTITDANNCDTTLTVSISQPTIPLGINLNSQTDILCNGAATGIITVIGFGGTPGYSYSINGGFFNTLTTFNNLPAGNHVVTIRDANGCLETLQVTLTEPPPLIGSVRAQKDATCQGDSSGWVSVLGAGGVPGYTYSIDGSTFGPSPTFSGLPAGSYLVTIRDANGCLSLVPVSVSEPPAVSASLLGQVDVNCVGDNTGSFSISGSGGYPGYMFSIDGVNFQASGTFNNLSSGPYTVIIRDDSACVTTLAGIDILQPDTLRVNNLFQRNVDCNGNTTGAVNLQGTGGNPGYAFSIDGVNFATAPGFSGLAAGNYTVTVRDDSLCTATLAVTITEPPVLSGAITSQIQVDCNGNSTGVVTLAGAGGTAPYQYSIDGVSFSANDTFMGLAAGPYTITIQDDSSCLTTVPVTVTEPAPLAAVFVSKTDVDCFGNANGSLTVTGAGGTAPYEFALANITNFQSSGLFTQLPPTTFQVVVRDANLCTDTILVSVTTPTGLTVNVDSVIHVGCNGDSTGKIRLSPSGATAPYQMSLDGVTYTPVQFLTGLPAGSYFIRVRDAQNCIAAFSLNIDEPPLLTGGIRTQRGVDCNGAATGFVGVTASGGSGAYRFSIDGVNFGPDSTFFNLTAGPYTVTILDDSNCVHLVPVIIGEPSALSSSIRIQENISCFGANDGFVALTTSGGVPPYQFSFDGGPFQPDSIFANLGPGMYTLTAMDDSLCTVDVQVTIAEPDTLVLQNGEQINVDCNGNATGQVTVFALGGSVPYQYAIDGGPLGPSPVFSGLAAGSYTITVVDDSSCQATLQVVITEPPVLDLVLADQENVDCFGNDTGSFLVTASGGTPAYAYSVDGTNFSPSPSFTDLIAGMYTVTVRDDSSCVQSLQVEITEPDLLSVDAVGTDVRCFEGSDGTVTANVTGGTLPYTITWTTNPPQSGQTLNNLPKGTYPVEVVDANGCEAASVVSIDHPPLLQLALGDTVHPYCDWANGSIEVSAFGGVSSVYQFAWNTTPVLSEPSITGLLGGMYTVVVTDENGCTDTLSVELINTPPAIPVFITEPGYENPILESEAPIMFLNASEGAIAWRWDFGDGIGSSIEENPSYTYNEPGEYPVTLTAYNRFFDCPTDTTILLNIIPDGALFFANAFSPNGDNVNDLFYFQGEGLVEVEARIFSRWGQEVAVLTAPGQGWDGTYKGGGPVPEGVYVFVVKATFNNGAVVERGGSITLLR